MLHPDKLCLKELKLPPKDRKPPPLTMSYAGRDDSGMHIPEICFSIPDKEAAS
jgi:hypothetical protein